MIPYSQLGLNEKSNKKQMGRNFYLILEIVVAELRECTQLDELSTDRTNNDFTFFIREIDDSARRIFSKAINIYFKNFLYNNLSMANRPNKNTLKKFSNKSHRALRG